MYTTRENNEKWSFLSNAHRHNIFTSNVVIITKLIGRTRQLLETMLDRVSRGLGSPFRQRVTCWPFAKPATSIYSTMVYFYFYKNRTKIITTNYIFVFQLSMYYPKWKTSTVYITQFISTHSVYLTHRFRENHAYAYKCINAKPFIYSKINCYQIFENL